MNSALWVRPQHRDALVLTTAFYTNPLKEFNGFILISKTSRIGVYQKGNQYIIVCRGTDVKDPRDIFDDARIAGLLGGELTIDHEARVAIEKIGKDKDILVTGHSLGGRAAMTVAKEYDLKAAVFNPAAPFTNPLVDGPGAKKATAYHITGDFISSHISPEAGEVVRVNQGYNVFQTLDAHTLSNFTSNTPTYSFYTVDQEDVYLYSTLALAAWQAADSESYQEYKNLSRKVKPIPGSSRSTNGTRASVLEFGGTPVFILGKLDSLDDDIRVLQATFKLSETGFLPQKFKQVTTFGNLVKSGQNAIRNVKQLGQNLRELKFLNATGDYQRLKNNVDEMNKMQQELWGKQSFSESDVLLTKSHEPLNPQQILDGADLQMIGLEDDVIAKIEFSPKTPNPSQYLDEAANALPPIPRQLEEVQQVNLYASSKLKTVSNPLTKAVDVVEEAALVNKGFRGASIIRGAATKLVKAGNVAKRVLVSIAKIAGRVSAVVFKYAVPLIAAVDLGYTAYLIGKSIDSGDWNDVVEHLTGARIEDWEKAYADLVKISKVGVPQYVDELVREKFNIQDVSEGQCPPGNALYWDGYECKPNPCEKRNGEYGIYDPKSKKCRYTKGFAIQAPEYLQRPGWNVSMGYSRQTIDQRTMEQKQALNQFNDNRRKSDLLNVSLILPKLVENNFNLEKASQDLDKAGESLKRLF